MYAEYAKDPRMKLNLGIRRRLAPLLDNGRDEIELLTAILFSLPGSPVLYYGDEIGMGDNIYLGDRDGVRTPMQWTGDRNGGFSRADFAQLYLPPLMDPVYGYQAVNVEAQLRTPTSLLRWLHRFIALRKEHPVFALGTLRGAAPGEPAHPRAHPAATRTRSRSASTTSRARPRRSSSTCRAFEGLVPGGDARPHALPAHRRAALPAHARRPRLLLVPARGGRVTQLSTRARELVAEDAICSRSSASSAGSARRRARSPARALVDSGALRRRAAAARRRARRDALRLGHARPLPADPRRGTTATAHGDRRRRRRSTRRPPTRAFARELVELIGRGAMLDAADGHDRVLRRSAARGRRRRRATCAPLGVEQSNTLGRDRRRADREGLPPDRGRA